MEVIRKLENVQRRATKLIPSLQNLTYSKRLHNHNLPSLSYQCSHMDLIMAYKILNEDIPVDNDYNYNEHKPYHADSMDLRFNRTSTRQFTFI